MPRARREQHRAVVATLATMPTVQPTAAELAAVLGTTPGELAEALAILEGRGRIERWKDGAHTRVMLSAREANRRGLTLGRRPERWIPVMTTEHAR